MNQKNCRSCPHLDFNQANAGDMVSRQAVIDAVKTYWKQQLDALDKHSGFETVTDACGAILEHNVGILNVIEQLPSAEQPNSSEIPNNSDMISRQAAIDDAESWVAVDEYEKHLQKNVVEWLKELPTAEPPQRDIPKKPHEVTDRAWGISTRQAVCPNCDAYLGMVHFICESDKKKVTYCESCGQAIDWTDWEDDLISRQAEIDELHNYLVGKNVPCDGTLTARLIENEVINKLPPAQPETTTMTVGRTKGEITMWYECDNCGEPVDQSDNYCRNCGRKFRKNE